mgnify:CR=1 FL=1
MGYTTDFEGTFALDRPLSPEHAAYLRAFSHTRRMARSALAEDMTDDVRSAAGLPIGEESGSLDHMLGKAADFFEAEVDDMVAGISSLMEPIIIVVLGTVIGGIVVAMYLPIFKLGQVV